MTRRPRDTAELARLVGDMPTGEMPNDKYEVLAAMGTQRSPSRDQPRSFQFRRAPDE